MSVGHESVAGSMRRFAHSTRWLCVVGLCALADTGSARAAEGAPKPTVVVERAYRDAGTKKETNYRLLRDQDKHALVRVDDDSAVTEISCGALEGAWGLWIEDVDGDSDPEAVIALRKTARFDPVLENRLHIYALVGDRCVPMWRGTRLAGRFDTVKPIGGSLFALERIGRGRRRIVEYRWTGFGYALVKTLWAGTADPPIRLLRKLNL